MPTTVTLSGTGSAHVTTGDGADFVVTGDGADTIHTGGGNDVVDAGAGDDDIVGGQGGGDDVYDGGTGVNTVSYPSATHGITVDLRTSLIRSAQPTIDADGAADPMWTPSATCSSPPTTLLTRRTCRSATREGVDIGTDVLINIQNATGGAGDDTIIGNERRQRSQRRRRQRHHRSAAAEPTPRPTSERSLPRWSRTTASAISS